MVNVDHIFKKEIFAHHLRLQAVLGPIFHRVGNVNLFDKPCPKLAFAEPDRMMLELYKTVVVFLI